MKNLYSQLSDMTPEQRALFERRLREKGMKKPFFVTLQGISSHMTFHWIPEKQRYLYKDNKDKRENFANNRVN